jgi:hypothetical protein
MGNPDPTWRTALCWGAVITFFVLPLVVFVTLFLSFTVPSWTLIKEELEAFKWVGTYENTLAALVFGLAGLNTWDKRK